MPLPKSNEASVTELVLSLSSLIRRIRAEAPSALSELSWTQKAVINRLDKEGPQTTADLARAEGVKPQSMGTALAALEQLDLIERKPHPTDGRQMNIALTSNGKTMRKKTREAKHSWLLQAIETLDKREQAILFEAGEIIKRLIG